LTGGRHRPAARACTRSALKTGITVANLSVLKNGRARAIRYSTLTAICAAVGCQPGDLLTVDLTASPRA
jgi:putative transcriptional regulator